VTGTGSFKAAYNLALWYEVSGQTEKAVKYYKDAAAGFEPAEERLKKLVF
jgi:Flp pilus assembly protein TadD